MQNVHEQFDQESEELQKCLKFYEQQLMLYSAGESDEIPHPGQVATGLETFEQIQMSRAIHESDDTQNFTGKDAINHAMNAREKQLVNAIVLQNRMNKRRKLWKPDRINLGRIINDVVKKHDANGGGPTPNN